MTDAPCNESPRSLGVRSFDEEFLNCEFLNCILRAGLQPGVTRLRETGFSR